MANETNKKIQLIATMVLFGTIGLFVRNIHLPSSIIALVRGSVGALCLVIYLKLKGRSIGFKSIRKNALLLILAGAAMGTNWILLFQAYHYTTVAIATLAYYLAPIIIILVTALTGKEHLTPFKGFCAVLALVGMVLVSGLLNNSSTGSSNLTGILLGLGAAVFYAAVVLINRELKAIDSFDATMVQLAVGAAVLLPWVLLTEDFSAMQPDAMTLISLFIVAVVHTGIAYVMYFGSIQVLKAQTVAIYSYMDPLVAVLVSAVILQEGMTLPTFLGGALILGSTFFSEMADRREAARKTTELQDDLAG